MVSGENLPNQQKLYVGEAMKKTDREAKIQQQNIEFKNNRNKSNLFVKGFTEEMTLEELR